MVSGKAVALRLSEVSKTYGDVRALDGLSFEVAEGRFFALFGPSSVGKTTTLARHLRTRSARQRHDPHRRSDVTHAPIKGRGVSMVFQSFALYPHLTVSQNLAYPLVEEGVPPNRDRPPGARDRRNAAARASA